MSTDNMYLNSNSDFINPTLIAQIASRLYNEVPEAGTIPKSENDAANTHHTFPTGVENKAELANSQYGDYYQQEAFNNQHVFSDEKQLNLNQNSEQFRNQSWNNHVDFQNIDRSNDAFQQPNLDFLPKTDEKQQSSLGGHADNLVDQQTYTGNKDGSYGLSNFINRSNSNNKSQQNKKNKNKSEHDNRSQIKKGVSDAICENGQ